MAKSPAKSADQGEQQPATATPETASTSSQAVATIRKPKTEIVLSDGTVLKVARRVTLPQLKQKDGQIVVIRFLEPYYKAKQILDKDGNPTKDEPPHVARVFDLESGHEYQYIVAAVVQSAFKDDYPNDGYVGKTFAIQMIGKAEGKRHKDYSVIELTE